MEEPLLDVVAASEGSGAATAKAKRCSKLNPNVASVLALCAIGGFADSIWVGTVLISFVFALTDQSNTLAGVLEAMAGIAQLFTALPVGWLADRFGRGPICRVGGVFLLLATGTSLVAVINPFDWSNTVVYYALCFAMVVWGISEGISNGPAQALFADSVAEGERSTYYTVLMMCYMLPSALGPAVCIVLFSVWGDTWTLAQIRIPFVVGLCLEIPAAVFLFTLTDEHALVEKEGEAAGGSAGGGSSEGSEGAAVQGAAETAAVAAEKDALLTAADAAAVVPDAGHAAAHENVGPCAADNTDDGAKCGCLRKAHIPYILFTSDLLSALASGMTVKFFPLFFKNCLLLSPARVQIIYVIAPVSIALFSVFAEALHKRCRFGRVQTVLLMTTCGVSLLVALALLFDGGGLGADPTRRSGWMSQWYVIVPVYIARTSFMNCSYALQESILMDSVPKDTRARWKTLQSVSVLGWCGSAVVGGVLADHFGYTFTFLITALLQGCGGLIFGLLLPLVPRLEGAKEEKPALAEEGAAQEGGAGAVQSEEAHAVVADQ